MINNIIPITANGTSQLYQTLATQGYQFIAFINGNAGSWGGATIEIQISATNTSKPITIATLTESAPFIEKVELSQGLYLQAVVSNANVGTSLQLMVSPLGVYTNG